MTKPSLSASAAADSAEGRQGPQAALPRAALDARARPAPARLEEHTRAQRASARPAIVVVDDDPSVLRSLARLLSVRGFDVKPFATPEALLAEIAALAPDCVIADLSMPGLSGLDLQRRLDQEGLDYPMVFLTGHGDIRTSVLAMRGGAVDFLTKPFDPKDLLDAVQRAIARRSRAREAAERVATVRQRLASLTQREREVFDQVVAGYLNKQIAANLGISEKTVKVHRARVMRKMSVRSLAQLARAAEQIRADAGGRALI